MSKPRQTVRPEADEARWVIRAKTDPEAFGLLYERYVQRIYQYLYYRTGNTHEAEDLTARVFQRALTNMKTYQAQGLPFSAWLYRIAHNLVANWYRDQARRKTISIHDPAATPHLRTEAPEALTEQNEERTALLQAIRRLPAERQQVLILKFVERLSNTEIGVIMERSEGAVKSLYHRTLLALREELERPNGYLPL